MTKKYLPTKEDYKKIIETALIKKGIIKSYSHKPHLQSLPYDLSTTKPKELQERYNELTKRINEIEENYGWESKAFHGSYHEPDNIKQKRMDAYEKKYKKIDKQIYKECKDIIQELKPLMDEVNKIYEKNQITGNNGKKEDAYAAVTNYGNYGTLNPYEAFKMLCNQFKSKNAGKGNQINENGFYSYSPDNFSFAKGDSYLNHILTGIINETSYAIKGYTIQDINKGKLPTEDLKQIPTKQINEILDKLSYQQKTYNYKCRKVETDYKYEVMKQMNDLRDYNYEKERIEKYCQNNNIPIKTGE